MKKVAGILCIAGAVLLLGSIKPMGEDLPRIVKIEEPVKQFGEDLPRIVYFEEKTSSLHEELPRLI